MDEFREIAKEPVELSARVSLQVFPSAIWVGLYRLDGSPHGGGTHVWSRRYERPAGKTLEECVEACLRMALAAQQGGRVVV